MAEPLNWMRSFEVAARHGSLTGAASELGMTQAAISQQIKALEGRLGIQVFHREARGVSLTPQGKELYFGVADYIEGIDSTLDRLRKSRDGEMSLSILCNTSLALRWLLPRLPKFCNAHPDIRLKFRTALWQTDALGANADVQLSLDRAQNPSRSFPLSAGRCSVVGYPGTDKEQPKRVAIVVGWEKLCDNVIYQGARLEVDSFHAAISFAESGTAVAICPTILVADLLAAGRLKEIQVPTEDLKVQHFCSFLSAPNEATDLFESWIRQQIATPPVVT